MIMRFSSSAGKKKKANWLLHVLVMISLGIHLVAFIHISGLYSSEVLSYIELTLQDVSKATPRNIPRPRRRPPPPKLQDVEKLKVNPRLIPSFKPLKLEPSQTDSPDSIVEPIAMPSVPSTPSAAIEKWSPAVIEDTSDKFTTPASYLEMVRLKIERHKRYPEDARTKQLQGSVKVKFVITPEGEIKNPQVTESSRHASLDAAALQAVRSAAPFPRPPKSLFKGEVPLRITVVFELI